MSPYPFSLDLLTKKEVGTFHSFFVNTIIPLAYRGLGSVESLLNLKMYILEELKDAIADENLENMFKVLHGLKTD